MPNSNSVQLLEESTDPDPESISKVPPRSPKSYRIRVNPGVNLSAGMLENNRMTRPKRPIDFMVSGLAHSALVALILLIPLLFTNAMDLTHMETTYLIAPPPPPPPPPPGVVHPIHRPKLLLTGHTLYAPRVIPKTIVQIKDLENAPATQGVIGGVPGGVPGGQLGGVIGGILGGSTHFLPPAPPPPKAPLHKGPYRVGGQVQPPLLIHSVQPQYPVLARQIRAQGDVILDCVIDPTGDVTQMKLVSGNPLLVQAAFGAVSQWRYRPTLLNGTPVPVEMEVTVQFRISS